MRISSVSRVGIALSLAAAVACSDETVVDSPQGDQGYAQAPSERVLNGVDVDAWRAERAELHQWLMSELPDGVLESAVEVKLTADELRSATQTDVANPRRIKVGLEKGLADQVPFGGNRGVLATTPDGGFVWSVAIESPNASALRVRFAHVSLPAEAEMYVYNVHGEVYGPYEGDGPLASGAFWSNTVTGSEAIVQIRYLGPATTADINRTSAVITHIGHLTSKYLTGNAPCSFNASCVESAACYDNTTSGWPSYENTSNAVAQLLFPSKGSFYICSGGLLSNTAGAEIPYLLTANHCFSKSREASGLEAAFQFVQDVCPSDAVPAACPDVFHISPKMLGGTILATSRDSDFTFVQLNGQMPTGTTLLGWDSAPIAYQEGALLHRLSHPGGAPQAYSEHKVDTATGTCSSWPRGGWIYSHDELGATEGGSSGSVVLNDAGLVVGQLSGACGYNTGDVCDSESNATVDGALAAYFPQVAPYLDPSEPADADGDGYDTTTDCDDSDPDVNPGAAEVCGDGIDNNCADGIDEGCGGGGECFPKGTDCTSSDECCSGMCHPVKRTCK